MLQQRCNLFRPNAPPRPKTGSDSAFQRNTAERVYQSEAAHNPEVAGSNPAPATGKAPETGPFSFPATPREIGNVDVYVPKTLSADRAQALDQSMTDLEQMLEE